MQRTTDAVDVFEVVERFSHAHKDDICDLGSLAFFVQEAGILQVPVHVDDFFKDFACFEVSCEAHLGGAAEGAVHGAAHLGRDAYGIATVCGNHHCFDMVAVVGPEKPLDGSVDRYHAGFFGQGAERELICQFFAESGGDVPHFVVAFNLLAEKPFLNLACTERLFVLLAEPSLELVLRQGFYVLWPFHRGLKIAKKYIFVKGENALKNGRSALQIGAYLRFRWHFFLAFLM